MHRDNKSLLCLMYMQIKFVILILTISYSRDTIKISLKMGGSRLKRAFRVMCLLASLTAAAILCGCEEAPQIPDLDVMPRAQTITQTSSTYTDYGGICALLIGAEPAEEQCPNAGDAGFPQR